MRSNSRFQSTNASALSVRAETVARKTSTVTVTGRLDAALSLQFRAEVDRLLHHGCDGLVVDLSEVDFVDSVGLAALVKAMGAAAAARAAFTIQRPRNEDAMRVFRLSKFDEIFSMRSS